MPSSDKESEKKDALPTYCTLRHDLWLVCNTNEHRPKLVIKLYNQGFPFRRKEAIKRDWFNHIQPSHLSIEGPLFASDLELLIDQLNLTSVQTLTIHSYDENNFQLSILNKLPSLTGIDISNNALSTISLNDHCDLERPLENQGDKCSFPLGQQIETLAMANNDFFTIPIHFLELFPHLRNLDVSGNLLQDISAESLRPVPLLRKLHIDNNRVLHLPAHLFSPVPGLEILTLNKAAISHIHESAFAGLTALQTLELGDNPIKNLTNPKMFSQLTALQMLNLDRSDISVIDEHIFTHNTELRELLLDHNELRRLPRNVFRGLTRLSRLRFSHNRITSLPTDIFSSLTNLTYISLVHNHITHLTASHLQNLTQLQVLSLNSNPFGTLSPDMFSNSPSLQRVHLRACGFSTAPPNVFQNMTKLRHLSLSDNQLTQLKLTTQLPSLAFLDLGHNPLQEQPDITLMPAVKVLRLTHHRINTIDLAALFTLKDLKSLELAAHPEFEGKSQAKFELYSWLDCVRPVGTPSNISDQAIARVKECFRRKGMIAPERFLSRCFRQAANATSPTQHFDAADVETCLRRAFKAYAKRV